jgi:hypothetical protein
MKKYLGLYLLGISLCASVVAVAAVPKDSLGARAEARLGADQIGQLDGKLNEKIAEQQELLRIVQRLLQISAIQNSAAMPATASPLSGKPGLPEGPARAVASAIPAPPAAVVAPPWWNSFKLQLVYWSGGSAEAVINGKMYRKGQTIDDGVWVESIESGSVVLARERERHTYWLSR